MYIYVYTYIYIHICVCVYIYMYKYIYIVFYRVTSNDTHTYALRTRNGALTAVVSPTIVIVHMNRITTLRFASTTLATAVAFCLAFTYKFNISPTTATCIDMTLLIAWDDPTLHSYRSVCTGFERCTVRGLVNPPPSIHINGQIKLYHWSTRIRYSTCNSS